MIIVARFQSESNCERLISKQKHTTGDYGTNYGCKTMQARLGNEKYSFIIFEIYDFIL